VNEIEYSPYPKIVLLAAVLLAAVYAGDDVDHEYLVGNILSEVIIRCHYQMLAWYKLLYCINNNIELLLFVKRDVCVVEVGEEGEREGEGEEGECEGDGEGPRNLPIVIIIVIS
jgi:hypothetical protein